MHLKWKKENWFFQVILNKLILLSHRYDHVTSLLKVISTDWR